MIIKLGNIANKNTQGRSVYHIGGICPTLTAGMTHGNTVPFIVIKEEHNEDRKFESKEQSEISGV